MRSSRCRRSPASSNTISPMRRSVLRLRGGEGGGELGVDAAVGGQDLAGVAGKGLAAIAGDAPARFGDQERAGGDVPRLDLELPIAVHPAGGDEAEVERGRAHAPEALRERIDV